MEGVRYLPEVEAEELSIISSAKTTATDTIKENEKEKDLPDSIRGLISLDSNTVRYLNKRKPTDKTNSAYTFHASRANVVSVIKCSIIRVKEATVILFYVCDVGVVPANPKHLVEKFYSFS